MIQHAGRQTGNAACVGTGYGDVAIRGFAVCNGGIGRCAPDNAMLGWIGYAERGDIAVSNGIGGSNGGDGLSGDCRCNESCECEILTIRCACRAGSISANMIQRPGVRPVMELVKVPVALTEPSIVLKSAVVGLAVVAQTKPCSVGLKVPRTVIFP